MIHTPVAINIPLYTDKHGKIRIGDTRILLELVIHAFQQGESAEGILEMYSVLKLADVYAVLAYYLANRADVDAYVRQADANSQRIQQAIEAQYTPETLALRARLRASHDAK
jgi:uncharacterized protein (DUF433 family)